MHQILFGDNMYRDKLPKNLVNILQDKLKGFQVFFVGGCVRDILLEKTPKDWDICTNALPEQIEQAFKGHKLNTIGKRYGTVGIKIDTDWVEITTFRKEKYTERSRKPEVSFTDIKEDLIRRDFTINALAVDVFNEHHLLDLFNGQVDLKNKILRTPRDARDTFKEDPLRMLRMIRFCSKLGFRPTQELEKIVFDNAYRLMFISKERIQTEVSNIILGGNVKEALCLMADTRLLNFTIPELVPLINLIQDTRFHHKDVWRHTVMVVENTPINLELRWAALLHDIGKPYTRVIDKKGVHFYNHEDLGAEIAEAILFRLRFSKIFIYKVKRLILEHMKPNLYTSNWSIGAIRRFKKNTADIYEDLMALSRADITSQNPERIGRALGKLNELKERVANCEECAIRCPISGKEIMERFNLPAGQLIGDLKKEVLLAIEQETIDPEIKENIFDFLERRLQQ